MPKPTPSAPNYVPGVSYLKPRVGSKIIPSVPGTAALPGSSALPETETGILDKITSGADFLKDTVVSFIQNLDPNTLAAAVSLGATLSVGGAALWYCRNKGSQSEANADVKPSSNTMNSLNANNEESEELPTLHLSSRGRRTPSIAPLPFKIETFLRVHQISYRANFYGSEPKSPNSPVLTLSDEVITDDQDCIDFIVEKYGLNPDKALSETEISMARAFIRLLEDHLYWGIALWRWVYDGARTLQDIQVMPESTLKHIPDICRTVEHAAWFHGLGRRSQSDVIEAVNADLRSLSEFLGKKEFFMGGTDATELDCSAFATLSQILWNMDGSPWNNAFQTSHKNLADFCWRMRVKYWQDWDECLTNNETETTETAGESLLPRT